MKLVENMKTPSAVKAPCARSGKRSRPPASPTHANMTAAAIAKRHTTETDGATNVSALTLSAYHEADHDMTVTA